MLTSPYACAASAICVQPSYACHTAYMMSSPVYISVAQMGMLGVLHKAAGECFSQNWPCIHSLRLPIVWQAAVCRL